MMRRGQRVKIRTSKLKAAPALKKTAERTRGGKGDLFFLFAVVFLAAFGVVAVYSASSYNAEVQYGDAFYFFKKQLLGFVLGLAGMIGIAFVPYQKFKKAGIPALVVALILLALVFIPGVGKSNYGATRWIGFGSFTIQPSELAKYAFVLFTAGYFAKNPARMRTFKGTLPVLGAGIAICVLIMLEPNMSVTMCVAALMIGMLFLGGTSYKTLASICVPALLLVPVLIAAEPYRLQRLSAFMNPVIGVVVWRGFRIANSCDNFFGYLLVSGIVLAFAVQSALNALVVSGCIPPTGLPLPLISAGNTSLIVTMCGMGIVYGVSRHNQARKFIRYSK